MDQIEIKELLAEIGKMHLQIMTLQRQLAEAHARITMLTPNPEPPAI